MPPAAFDLFTIGHSNHPIERFLDLLRGAGVTAVADVRSIPASRRYPWFNAARLKARLEAEGIAYVPLGDALGGRPREDRLYRDDGVADYAAMACTEEFRAGLGRHRRIATINRVARRRETRLPDRGHEGRLINPARSGPIEVAWHDGGPLFGHPVELHQHNDVIAGMHARLVALRG